MTLMSTPRMKLEAAQVLTGTQPIALPASDLMSSADVVDRDTGIR